MRSFLKEPVALFEKIYAKVPAFLSDKQNLYMEGIESLRAKKCNIIFVDFPYHKLLKKIVDISLVAHKTNEFSKSIINSSNKIKVDTLWLDNDKELMHDLTHLNNYGAKQVALYLSQKIKDYKGSINNEGPLPFEIYCKLNN